MAQITTAGKTETLEYSIVSICNWSSISFCILQKRRYLNIDVLSNKPLYWPTVALLKITSVTSYANNVKGCARSLPAFSTSLTGLSRHEPTIFTTCKAIDGTLWRYILSGKLSFSLVPWQRFPDDRQESEILSLGTRLVVISQKRVSHRVQMNGVIHWSSARSPLTCVLPLKVTSLEFRL